MLEDVATFNLAIHIFIPCFEMVQMLAARSGLESFEGCSLAVTILKQIRELLSKL